MTSTTLRRPSLTLSAPLLALCGTLLPALLPTLAQAQTPPQPPTSLPQLIATVLATHPAVQGQRAQRNTLPHAQM